jgi:hypothetical protein
VTNEEREDLLIDMEYALYVISQDIPGDAKDVLPELGRKLRAVSLLGLPHRDELVAHVDSALKALHANYNYRQASWHLWKVHRALTGRSW